MELSKHFGGSFVWNSVIYIIGISKIILCWQNDQINLEEYYKPIDNNLLDYQYFKEDILGSLSKELIDLEGSNIAEE